MPEDETLSAQAKHLQAQLDKLATYASTLRRQEGRLGELNYRYNSHIRLTSSEQQERVDLPRQLRETRRAFRQEFPGMPATTSGIDKAIQAKKSALSDLKMLQENQERLSHLSHTRSTHDGWRELVEAASRNLSPEPREQHTPPKRPLRDLYTPDAERPEQQDEPERSR